MPIDVGRVLSAAVEAAIDEARRPPPPKRKRHRMPARRAVLVGAGLVTAGRLGAGSRGRQLLAAAQQRIDEYEERLIAEDDGSADAEPDAEE